VVPDAKKDGDGVALNAEQQQVARMLGMTAAQYTKHIEGVN
jgi:phage I-like protein